MSRGAPSLLRRNRPFARLAAAETISPLGDAMGTLALILFIQAKYGTALAASAVLVAESIPPLLAPLLGAIADRADRRRLVIVCELGQAVAMGAAAFLPPLAVLAALVLVRGAFASVFAAATGAALPEVVADDDLDQANTMLGVSRELGSIVGPVLAGLLFAVGGARPALLLDAATFLVTIPLLATLPRRGTTLREETLLTSARLGLRTVFSTRIVRGIALGFWLAVLASAGDDLIIPFFGRDALDVGPVAIGVLAASASVGLVGGLALLVRRNRPAAIGAVVLGFSVIGAGNLATGLAPVLGIAVATQVVRGGGIALVEANVRTLIQRSVPREVLGRVLANVYGGVGVAAALSYVIAGVLIDATSARTAFVVCGVAGLAAAAVTALLTRPRPNPLGMRR